MSGMIGLEDDLDRSASQLLKEQDIAKHIAEQLHEKYPDHLWGVNVDLDGGIATIRNLRLSGNWGFVLHLNKLLPLGYKLFNKAIMRSGGEILERYQLARGRYNEDTYSQLHYNSAGRLKAE